MKIIVNKANKQEYPCLKIADDGDIVLFVGECDGFIVSKSTKPYSTGYYSNTWSPKIFKTFKGSITLEND